ncbi:uncharacterized protein LOC127639958 isoform X1 [Xyrauchen texanus]|uniref:uncharacterized protein LOC127639958 isoform X1 n=1 Tax=Xyrauchen texanus TaxID=154827 RepID=UPI00224284A9|nr:uncharacterized protein LOC127639958 isoform X1 [Xyrauchen texanus]XP_051978272.1 uncharacterized protein LOC127639958 isoform X1 [Xyrauchen texanus]
MDRLYSEIFFLLITGVFIRSTFQKEKLHVHLKPKNIKVREGASVTIKCTFPSSDMKVSWHYSQTSNSICDLNNKLQGQHINSVINRTWSTLHINNIRSNESGWYSCNVIRDIPYLEEVCSNGTHVIVDVNIPSTHDNQDKTRNTRNFNQNTTNLPTTYSSSATTSTSISFNLGIWWIWLALAVGCVVLVVSVVVIWILACRTKGMSKSYSNVNVTFIIIHCMFNKLTHNRSQFAVMLNGANPIALKYTLFQNSRHNL